MSSFDKPEQVYGSFVAKEGIHFVSYSKEWNTDKLKSLYSELIKNKHGKELALLRNVYVYPDQQAEYRAEYMIGSRSIVLYYGNVYTKASDYRELLAHEYGHHVQHIYFPGIENDTNSTWLQLRGLKGSSYLTGDKEISGRHKEYLCEIFAEDYVMLYGDPNTNMDSGNEIKIYNDSISHENQDIPNIMDLKKEQNYLEKVTGWKIDQKNLVSKITAAKIAHHDDDSQTYLETTNALQKAVKYYAVIDFYEKDKKIASDIDMDSQIHDRNKIAVNLTNETSNYTNRQNFSGEVRVIFRGVNIHSGRSVDSEPFYVSVKNNNLYIITNNQDLGASQGPDCCSVFPALAA